MAAPKAPFTTRDAVTAASIAGVTLTLVASILLSAERVKRDSAETVVEMIAAANKKRLAAGKPAVTGRVDDASVLVAEGEIETQEWDALPYVFTGAERSRDACVLAAAVRRHPARGEPTPVMVDVQAQQVIEEVIARADRGEHLADTTFTLVYNHSTHPPSVERFARRS